MKMRLFKFFLLQIALLLWGSTNNIIMVGVSARAFSGNETDRLALLAIKEQILEAPSSWNGSLHFCHWEGVSCSTRRQRVTQLNLTSRGLRGMLSPSIGNLSFLRILDLSNNSFQGELPSKLGHLFRLQELRLSYNMFRGPIPVSLSNCSEMIILRLSHNEFSGKIPHELGLLSRIVQLVVGENHLKGAIPPHLGNLTSLQVLRAESNQLEGDIPSPIGRLSSLVQLWFANNSLSGIIPQSVYNLSKLELLSIPDNQLQGSLPSSIGLTLKSIEQFTVWGNLFSGPIPVSFSNSSNLLQFDVSYNNFIGGVPPSGFGNSNKLLWLGIGFTKLGSGKTDDLNFISSLANCTSLKILFLDNSNFGGSLPNSIGNLSTSLEVLYLATNKLSGTIPHGIGNLVGLNSIALYSNQLRGTIPATIGKLHKLEEVGFGKNQLSGEIPFSFSNLSLLSRLWLEENNFNGSIPSSLGNCTRLRSLSLHTNELSGSIPVSVLALSSLSMYLRLSRNRLTGSLPLEVGSLKNLVELDISQNDLSGNIPSSLGDCIMLILLYMNRNRLTGPIPEALKSLKSLEVVDLSQNNFSGPIPKDFAQLVFLSKLNLSFNDLEGELPKGGVFGNASAISIKPGNDKLCGGIPELRLAACLHPKKGRFSFRSKLIVIIVCGLLGVAFTSSVLIIWMVKKRGGNHSKSSLNEPLMNISYGELLIATNGFDQDNLIGTGGVGSVYKGVLEPNQTIVAVKVMNLERRGASRSFIAECELLRNTRHRNLLKIVTACSSIDYQGNEFKALVYEFMPNGNLESWLHPNQREENGHERKLTLFQRMSIVIDVASALDYLHNHICTPAVHSDLKPSNILLDQDMVAHVGDFGLSRIISQDHDQQSSSVGLKGTIGYAAPEYGMGSRVSCSGDAYSFGILVLEIFTGKRPTDGNFDEGMNLNQFVQKGVNEGLLEKVIDLCLLPEEETEIDLSEHRRGENDIPRRGKLHLHECLISMLSVGVKCSEETPSERLEISQALKECHKIRNSLLEYEDD